MVNNAFTSNNVPTDGKISLSEYNMFIKNNEMAVQFTDTVKKMSNIYLGVKPETKRKRKEKQKDKN